MTEAVEPEVQEEAAAEDGGEAAESAEAEGDKE